jgi:hypothetical protein
MEGEAALAQPEGTLTVFTDDQNIKDGLTDSHFVHVDAPEDAKIIWPTGLDRPIHKAKAVSMVSYFNSFPFDEVLLMPDLLVQMVNNVNRHPKNNFDDQH